MKNFDFFPAFLGPDERRAAARRVPHMVGPGPKGGDGLEGWKPVVFLCLVGFLVNCQPSEPFLTRYLSEAKGLSEEQLDNQVWPYNTYASFLFFIPAGLLAESIGYRSVILLGLLCREATRLVLLFGRGVPLMATAQVSYAAATCANSVYYAYAYTVVAPEWYHRATGCMRGAYHLGNVAGAVLGQMLVSSGQSLNLLFYLSWGFTSAGLIAFATCLPYPQRAPPPSLAGLLRGKDGGWAELRRELGVLYSGGRTRLWSIYWLVMFGVHQMISNYYQNQIYAVAPDSPFGYIEAGMEAFAVLGAAAALAFTGFGQRSVAALIFFGSVGTAVCYLVSTRMSSLWLLCLVNVLPFGVYGLLFTMAASHIAIDARTPRYAMAFSLNSFVSLGVSCIVQQIGQAQELSTDGYYYIAAAECLALAACAVVWAAVAACRGYDSGYMAMSNLEEQDKFSFGSVNVEAKKDYAVNR